MQKVKNIIKKLGNLFISFCQYINDTASGKVTNIMNYFAVFCVIGMTMFFFAYKY